MRKLRPAICLYCKKNFEHREKQAKFCSGSCRTIFYNKKNVGKRNGNWKGGISKNNYHYKKLQVQRYPEKIAARKKVYVAIKYGKLIRGTCEVCEDTKVQAHHEDYLKPLEVHWLCRKHHREISLAKVTQK